MTAKQKKRERLRIRRARMVALHAKIKAARAEREGAPK